MAYNVSANNAIAFGAINDQFSCAKSNGATPIILYQMVERRCWACYAFVDARLRARSDAPFRIGHSVD